jgi:hypothetical protein
MKEVTRFFGKLLLLGFGFVLANACSSFDGNDGPSSGTSGGGSTGSTSGDYWKDYYSWGVPNIYIYTTPGNSIFRN